MQAVVFERLFLRLPKPFVKMFTIFSASVAPKGLCNCNCNCLGGICKHQRKATKNQVKVELDYLNLKMQTYW